MIEAEIYYGLYIRLEEGSFDDVRRSNAKEKVEIGIEVDGEVYKFSRDEFLKKLLICT